MIFSEKNPFPKANKNEMLNFMKSKTGSNFPTLHGSMSVKSRLSKQYLDILNDQLTIELLSKLLNSEKVFLHLCPAVRVIHPNFNFAFVPPHNDLSYNAHFKNRFNQNDKTIINFLTIWIPLKSNHCIDGGLKVFPSLKSFDIKTKTTNFWIKDMSTKFSDSINPEYKIGDIIIFEPSLIHGSAEISDKAKDFRISMDCRVFGQDTITPRHYMDLATGECYDPGEGPCGYNEDI